MTIANLNPERVWKNFYALTQIPRPSKKEGKVVEFMEKFGKSLGLETIKDEVGNIIIRKPATPGMENRKGIILQGHLDMVPQNNIDTPHDWEKDPIDAYEYDLDGEKWVKARGTTLGADNGMGVATAMAVLEAKDLVHGPIEALFTIDEETGMTGAFALKPGVLKGQILINLDSESEGEIYVGCAGGLDGSFTFDYKGEAAPKGYKFFEISVKGMRGGHSGMEINEGRGNANKTMARLLLPVLDKMDGRLASIHGGNLRNAIPREAVAVVAVPEANVSKMKRKVADIGKKVKAELALIDPNVVIAVKPAAKAKVMAGDVALNVVKAVLACPNEVVRMSNAMENLVETSSNLAMVNSDGRRVRIECLLRSSVDTAKENLADAIASVMTLAGGKVKYSGAYSGWNPNMKSPILAQMIEEYEGLYGKEPAVMAIHAGLECGVIGAKYEGLDMVSVGPTLCSPHSPDERVNVATVGKFWDFIVKVLANAPVKE
ncbi:MAG: aminoacyl-histidine dipeptidase [Bacteroidales bacterium]|nr:aminoacyl-histidine dipeptidase [Candidatus Equibacterium intestinale]